MLLPLAAFQQTSCDGEDTTQTGLHSKLLIWEGKESLHELTLSLVPRLTILDRVQVGRSGNETNFHSTQQLDLFFTITLTICVCLMLNKNLYTRLGKENQLHYTYMCKIHLFQPILPGESGTRGEGSPWYQRNGTQHTTSSVPRE